MSIERQHTLGRWRRTKNAGDGEEATIQSITTTFIRHNEGVTSNQRVPRGQQATTSFAYARSCHHVMF